MPGPLAMSSPLAKEGGGKTVRPTWKGGTRPPFSAYVYYPAAPRSPDGGRKDGGSRKGAKDRPTAMLAHTHTVSSFPSLRKRQQRREEAADEESAKVAGRRLAAQGATILLFSCYEGGKGVGLVLLLSLHGILGGREREEGLSWQRERVRRRRRVGPASRRGFSRDDFPSLTCADVRSAIDAERERERNREEKLGKCEKEPRGGHLYSFSSFSLYPSKICIAHLDGIERLCPFLKWFLILLSFFSISFLNSISLDFVRLPVFLSQGKELLPPTPSSVLCRLRSRGGA